MRLSLPVCDASRCAAPLLPDGWHHHRVGSDAAGWSSVRTFTSSPEPAAVRSGAQAFTWLVFNDLGQENAVLFDDVCPPYCPAGWQFQNYTGNSTKLLPYLMREEATLGLLVGDVSYANGFEVTRSAGRLAGFLLLHSARGAVLTRRDLRLTARCCCPSACSPRALARTRQADWDYFGFQFEPAFSRWPLAVASG